MIGMDSFVMMAMPLFIFMGEVMARGGITDDLIDFCNFFVGRFRGGLAYTNVLASTFFAGISGSALSDIASEAVVLVPIMEKSGYKREYASALTVVTAMQAPLIPPSVPGLTVAGVAGLSVGAVFIAGLGPGLLLGLICCIVVFIQARRHNLPVYKVEFTWRGLVEVCLKTLPGLLTPLIVILGIYSGIFTATEAAAIACAYAFFLTFVVRRFPLKNLGGILKSTVRLTSAAYLLIGLVNVFAFILSYERVPDMIANMIVKIGSPTLVLLALNIFLLFWGMWMDVTAAIVILIPLLFPVLTEMGLHPVHLGVIMILNLCIGLSSPPFGTALFLCSAVTKVKFGDLVRAMVPFYVVLFVVLFLVTYIPEIVLYVPRVLGLL
jgi:tripartite ATP-independent transporter DctM subunit